MIYLVETTEKTLVSLATNSQSMTIHWHSNTVTVHSNIRCSTNWNVSIRGKSLITNVLGPCLNWHSVKWMNLNVMVNVPEVKRCPNDALKQLRAINPLQANPEEFRASLKR